MLHSVCLLDASSCVQEAVLRLQTNVDRRLAVLRRQAGMRVFWYVVDRERLLNDLSRARPDLTLDAWGAGDGCLPAAAEPLQVGRAGAARLASFRGLVLDGDRVLGWQEPEAQDVWADLAPAHSERTGLPWHGWEPWDPVTEYFGGRNSTDSATPRSPRWFAEGDPAPSSARTADAFYAFPRLQAPAAVSPEERFALRVGVADRPVQGVSGGALRVRGLLPGTRNIELGVQVVAEGFSAPEGWGRTLKIVLTEPEAAEVEIPLVAHHAGDVDRLCSIEVHFAHRGSPCGFARRHVAVRGGNSRPQPARGGQAWSRPGPEFGGVRVPFGEDAPDLTVRISKPDANFATGRLAWSFISPHLELPAEPVFTDLGSDAQTFARSLVRMLGRAEDHGLATELMEGIGDAIRARAPDELWATLRQVAAIVQERERRPPSVLLLSAETYVPWELALVDPVFDPERPPFLGTQAIVGRWLLEGPPIPPPRTISVPQFAVVAAAYHVGAGVQPLPAAVSEGARLRDEHSAILVPLMPEQLRELLSGKLGGEDEASRIGAIHFACHGMAGVGDAANDVVVLDDGSVLNALAFRRLGVGAWH
ncbi:MAG TPA: TCAD7 domain-containing protein, partial [Longimicrobiaceae bacterium]|nr:TCAD7 domain-containing protein [Longimicrobiaceae bacterium]